MTIDIPMDQWTPEKYKPLDPAVAIDLCDENDITEDDTESFPDQEEVKEEVGEVENMM